MYGMESAIVSGNEALVAIFEHHKWSNLAMIDFCAPLADEQLSLTVPGTRGGVRDTMQHITGNEASYLSFFSGSGIRQEILPGSGFVGWTALRDLAARTSDALIRLSAAVKGDPIERGERMGEPYAVPTSVFLAQAINHATEHRSHIRTILSSHGITPPEIDGWAWLETLSDPST